MPIYAGNISGSGLTGSLSYINLTNTPTGIVSSSAQIAASIPAGTVSSSGQVDYNSITNKLSGVVSSSAQVTPLLPGGTVSSSGQVDVRNTIGIATLVTTGSNTFMADQIITGSIFITQNLTVQGSSSIQYVSSSILNVGTNVITMDVATPAVRFGGISVLDSGSSPARSGSMFFDSLNDQWIFIHQNQTSPTSSVLIMGPETYNNIGNETNLTTNTIPKSTNAEHIGDSQITDNGITVSITKGLSVGTNLTASQADITTLRATSITASVSGSHTGTFPYTSLISIPSGIFSSSAQLPAGIVSSSAGTVSSSAQYPGWVTASSQIDYNSISNKLSGVVSSSLQFNSLTAPFTGSFTGSLSGSMSASAVTMAANTLDQPKLKRYTETVATPVISASVLTLDCSTSNIFRVAVGANITTLTISNVGATSSSQSITLILDYSGTYTIAWPAAVKWNADTAPTLSGTGKTDFITLVTTNAGTRYYGFVGLQGATT